QLLAREVAARPAAPRPDAPLRARLGDEATADVQGALVPGEAGDELRRLRERCRGPALQDEHAAVRDLARLGAAVTLEYLTAAERERGGGLEARGDKLDRVAVGGCR